MDIDKMEAGREMDALVYEDIFDFKRTDDCPIHGLNNCIYFVGTGILPGHPLKLSTDISAAWLVEERIAELGLIDEYCWEIIKLASTKKGDPPQQWYLIHATPEDRCRAALKAMESK